MLRFIWVEDDSEEVILHPVDNPDFFETSAHISRREKVYCRLKLFPQYDSRGIKLPGKCSRICRHGVVACTLSFEFEFPMLIAGGKI